MGCCQSNEKPESYDLMIDADEQNNLLQVNPCLGDINDPEELTWFSVNYSFQSILVLPDYSQDQSLASWKF